MSFFSRHIDTLLNGHTIAALALIRTVAAFFIKDCLAHPCLVIFVYPFGVFFSSLAQYFFEQVELFTPHKLGQWLMWDVDAACIHRRHPHWQGARWPPLPLCGAGHHRV